MSKDPASPTGPLRFTARESAFDFPFCLNVHVSLLSPQGIRSFSPFLGLFSKALGFAGRAFFFFWFLCCFGSRLRASSFLVRNIRVFTFSFPHLYPSVSVWSTCFFFRPRRLDSYVTRSPTYSLGTPVLPKIGRLRSETFDLRFSPTVPKAPRTSASLSDSADPRRTRSSDGF